MGWADAKECQDLKQGHQYNPDKRLGLPNPQVFDQSKQRISNTSTC